MPILDTRTNKDLIGTLISDIVLQLLSYVTQTERENIKQRQGEGIADAKVRGKYLGRFPDPIPDCFSQIYEGWIKKISREKACLILILQSILLDCTKYKKSINKD